MTQNTTPLGRIFKARLLHDETYAKIKQYDFGKLSTRRLLERRHIFGMDTAVCRRTFEL